MKMKTLKTVALFLAAIVLGGTRLSAQTVERPVLSAYTLEAGSAHIAETYLSPLKYAGWSVALGYERMQAMKFAPEHWVMQLQGRLDIQKAHNPAGNARMWDLALDLRWGMAHRWRLNDSWTIYGGGSTGVDIGTFYNPRNSNNPVAAKAAWTINAVGAAAWNGRLAHIPLCLRYQAELPLTGVFFSPAYGELYYEIYLGNHKNLVRGAWPGNYFALNNLLSADLRFGRTTLRLGYRCNILSSKASHIVTRRVEHCAVVGVVCEWLSLAPATKAPDGGKIIRALY